MQSVGSGWDLPPGVSPFAGFHWMKVSPRRDLEVRVLCHQPVWYVGHFVKGRMVPCVGSECELCAEGIGTQTRWVFTVADAATRKAGLLEVSEAIALQIRDWVARYEGLRGMALRFSKHSSSLRSRTNVELMEMGGEPWYVNLEEPDAKMALQLTWKKMGCRSPFDEERSRPPSHFRRTAEGGK